jgi:UDP-glucose 6-dehydrogenase
MDKEKVVVIGYGWVGQANALALALDGYEVSVYDPGSPNEHYVEYSDIYRKIRRLKDPLETDSENTVYIVCVGDRVDEAGNQDISLIKKALEPLKNAKGTVVLRSTILPSYLKDLHFHVYLPEFLHEKAAVKECVNPQYIVVGKKSEDVQIPSFVEIWRKRSVKQMDCTPEQASHVKYLSNFWNSIRIAFVNEFGCSIEEPENNASVERIDTVINFIFADELYGKFGRSFGGHCLPKDTRGYTKWAEDNGKHASLLRGTVTSNEAHRMREEKHNHLKQWFSNWPEPTGSGWVALSILGKSIKRNLLHPIEALKRRKTVVKRMKI